MIRRALLSMGWGMLGALLLQGIVWVTVPRPPRLARVDMVAIMSEQVKRMAAQARAGTKVDIAARGAQIQNALARVAARSGRTLIASQALVAGTTADIPDLTDQVRQELAKGSTP